MTIDRRRKRSEMVQEAASLYLEAVAERSRIKAMALASEDGLLVAGVGRGYDHEWLAALGVTGAEEMARLGEVIEEVTGGEGLVSFDISVHGRKLTLSAVGAKRPAEDASIALGRIFAPLLAEGPSEIATG
jgi:hypothetical protein